MEEIYDDDNIADYAIEIDTNCIFDDYDNVYNEDSQENISNDTDIEFE